LLEDVLVVVNTHDARQPVVMTIVSTEQEQLCERSRAHDFEAPG
jgi:hypothetical protein